MKETKWKPVFICPINWELCQVLLCKWKLSLNAELVLCIHRHLKGGGYPRHRFPQHDRSYIMSFLLLKRTLLRIHLLLPSLPLSPSLSLSLLTRVFCWQFHKWSCLSMAKKKKKSENSLCTPSRKTLENLLADMEWGVCVLVGVYECVACGKYVLRVVFCVCCSWLH